MKLVKHRHQEVADQLTKLVSLSGREREREKEERERIVSFSCTYLFANCILVCCAQEAERASIQTRLGQQRVMCVTLASSLDTLKQTHTRQQANLSQLKLGLSVSEICSGSSLAPSLFLPPSLPPSLSLSLPLPWQRSPWPRF